MRNTAGT